MKCHDKGRDDVDGGDRSSGLGVQSPEDTDRCGRPDEHEPEEDELAQRDAAFQGTGVRGVSRSVTIHAAHSGIMSL